MVRRWSKLSWFHKRHRSDVAPITTPSSQSPLTNEERPVKLATDETIKTDGQDQGPTQPSQGHPDAVVFDRTADPLGLTLLHTPTGKHVADIIFIHGLGGSSRATWSKHRRLDAFWPKEWLPQDEELKRTRIFTFGYNAQFRSSIQSSSMGIADFSKSLLFDLLFGRDGEGRVLNIGNAPIIFVTHSMGGLVFKKAFLDAQLDPRFSALTQSIKAVLFLATPHRGSESAPYLNRILSLSFGQTSKQYVAELGSQAPFLRLVNEQFRDLAAGLEVFSFYETLQSSIGVTSTMIVDQKSAQLGHPGEICRPLNTNHYNACKFENADDPSYKAILGALKSVVASCSAKNTEPTIEETEQLRAFLSITESSDDDFDLFCTRRATGTCKWVLDCAPVSDWLSASTDSHVLRLHGRPGRGKSVIAAFIAQHLHHHGVAVQHFFFRAGEESKRSMAALIHALAFQIARRFPGFRKSLLSVAETGYKLAHNDWRFSLKHLLVRPLSEMQLTRPLYWVIDGLDEAANPHQLLEILADLQASKVPLRALVTSRWTQTIASAFDRTELDGQVKALSIDNDTTDMNIAVNELRQHGWGDDITEDVISKILERSNNNFLWVHLILEELRDCNTENEIRQCLVEFPSEMDALYRRMEQTIASIRRPSDISLAHQLLQWAMHSIRSLPVEELVNILEAEFGRLLDLAQTATRLCGFFVVVEGEKKIGIVHDTAREYLATSTTMPFTLSPDEAHTKLFQLSISVFMGEGMRSKVQKVSPTLYEYRATSWPRHLRAAGTRPEHLEVLSSFFTHTSVLVWIQVLASLRQLEVLKSASEALSWVVQGHRATSPDSDINDDLDCLETWSRDLLKILTRFGTSLYDVPNSIYTSVAPFCPTSSSMHKQFAKHASASLTVSGLPEHWDECLARLPGMAPSGLVFYTAHHLAIHNDSDLVLVWDTTAFRHISTLKHGEEIDNLCFSAQGDKCATYGRRTTRIWDPRTGKLLGSFDNHIEMQPMAMQLVDDGNTLIMASNRYFMLRASLSGNAPWSWDLKNPVMILDNPGVMEGNFLNAPYGMELSPDGSRLAIIWKGHPLTVWSITASKVLHRLNPHTRSDPFVTYMSWHPGGDEILGLLVNGLIFKLNIVDGFYKEYSCPGLWPSRITCSPDGRTYSICENGGTVLIFNYATSALLYQLTLEDTICGFSYSHDGRRFCDLRDGFCSVWEPDALSRLDRATDAEYDGADQSLQTLSTESIDEVVSLDIMAMIPGSRIVCVGDRNGRIDLFYYNVSKRIHRKPPISESPLDQIIWSEDGSRLMYSQMGGFLGLLSITKTPKGFKAGRVESLQVRSDETGPTDQIMFFRDAKSILVAFGSSAHVWCLESREKKFEAQFESSGRRWIVHPHLQEHLLSFTTERVYLHRQDELTEVCSWEWKNNTGVEPLPKIQEEIEDLKQTFYTGHVMLKLVQKLGNGKLSERMFLFDTQPMKEARDPEDPLHPVLLPGTLFEMAEIWLDVLPDGKLVFIDRACWVRSLKLTHWGGRMGDLERHFYIPRDWLPVKSRDLIRITESGAIISPRKDGVSVIESSLMGTW